MINYYLLLGTSDLKTNKIYPLSLKNWQLSQSIGTYLIYIINGIKTRTNTTAVRLENKEKGAIQCLLVLRNTQLNEVTIDFSL